MTAAASNSLSLSLSPPPPHTHTHTTTTHTPPPPPPLHTPAHTHMAHGTRLQHTPTHDTHAHATHAHDARTRMTRTCTQLHARARTLAQTLTRSTRSLHRPGGCLQSCTTAVESAAAAMDDPSIDQPNQYAAAAPRPAPPTLEARIAATLAATSLPANTSDGRGVRNVRYGFIRP